jgi:N-acetylglucosamine-6-phosphate deacetylase
MKTFLVGGMVLTPDQALDNHTLIIEGGRITNIVASRVPASEEDIVVDIRGYLVVPGFIDLHVHGAVNFDTMDAMPEALEQMGVFFVQHGVTSYLPTTVTASPEDIRKAIENVANLSSSYRGAQHLGIHLEGPCLSTEYRGAQPPQHLREVEKSESNLWLENPVVRLITVAPEVEGVLDLIKAGVSKGIEFAIGHSGASYEQVLVAVEHGLHQVTHIFNGMPGLHHRSPGVLGAALTDDRLWAQIIVDGIHVHPAIVKLLIAAKGINRMILITDAIRATGMQDGDYTLGDQVVHVQGGIARTDAGGLAGSTLTMDQALRNVMQFADLSIQKALPMATRVPAEALGMQGKKGVLAVDADADIVILDDSYQVRLTMVGGRIAYNNLNN